MEVKEEVNAMTVAPDRLPFVERDERLPVVQRADHVPGPAQGHWTYEAYVAIPDDGHRYEVIGGVLYMPPAPSSGHQFSNQNISGELYLHVQKAGLGRVASAPLDVILPPNNTTVQPDVVVILNANLSIITPGNIQGASDLVVEVSSPGTATYDRSTKLQAYAAAGVREYWLADPVARNVEVLVLEQGHYRSLGVFQGKGQLPSQVLPNFPTPVEQFLFEVSGVRGW